MVGGILRSDGCFIQREHIRQSLRRVDPVGSRMEASTGTIYRREYNVPSPNALCHIDSNHNW